MISKTRKELIALALIKLAGTDPDNAARLLDSKWGPQLSPEERNWVWGVLGKQAAQRLPGDSVRKRRQPLALSALPTGAMARRVYQDSGGVSLSRFAMDSLPRGRSCCKTT